MSSTDASQDLGLTAPELYVLQHGDGVATGAVLKVALLDLVRRDVLDVEKVEQAHPHNGKTETVAALTPGRNYHTSLTRSLSFIRDQLKSLPSPKPTVFELASQVRFVPYVTQEVMPVLLDRGLYRSEQYTVLWVIPATRHVITPAGEQARANVSRVIEEGEKHFPNWVTSSPERAMAFVANAGSAIVLMDTIFPSIQTLQQQIDAGLSSPNEPEEHWIAKVGDIYELVRDASDLIDAVDSGADGGDGGC